MLRSFFLRPFFDVMNALSPIMTASRPLKLTIILGVAMIATWFVYVPIHELLHAFGCIWTGGTVSELQIDAMYGASLLAQWFPFVTSGSEYAGRLTGFNTKGSDLCYLACVFAPFVLSIFPGVSLVLLCTRRPRPIVFGIALVLALAPFYSIPGDFFEIASILVTRVVTALGAGDGSSIAFERLRSDDVFRLIKELATNRRSLGLDSTGKTVAAAFIVLSSGALSVFLAWLTYTLGAVLGAPFARRPARKL